MSPKNKPDSAKKTPAKQTNKQSDAETKAMEKFEVWTKLREMKMK